MLSLFWKTKPSPKSNSWWNTGLTEAERSTIDAAFQPLGNISASSLIESGSPNSIGNLVSNLKKEPLRQLGYKLLHHADTLISEKTPVLDVHFYWASRGEYYYRWRDLDQGALDEAVKSFQQQIGFATIALKFFQDDKNWGFVPAHKGFHQLRIIEEKRGNLTLARALCEEAKSQGWTDDWDKHITRIDKKIAKQAAN